MTQLQGLTAISITDSGQNYLASGTSLTFSGGGITRDSSNRIKFGDNSLDMDLHSYSFYADPDSSPNPGRSLDGWLAFWMWVDSGAFTGLGSKLLPLYELGDKLVAPETDYSYRNRFGINSSGKIADVNKYSNNGLSVQRSSYSPSVVEGQWNHIFMSISGADSDFASRQMTITINGERAYQTNGSGFGGMLSADSGALFGKQLIDSDFNGVEFTLNGKEMYMDNLYMDSVGVSGTAAVNVGKKLFDSDVDGGLSLYTSTTTFAKYQSFNNSAPAATLVASGGKVTSVNITEPGLLTSVPVITFPQASSNNIKEGGVITQNVSGNTVTAEVAHYSDSDGIIHAIHLSSADGTFALFQADSDITVDSANNIYTLSAVAEENTISENEQNTDFGSFGDDFLDFSESNPFGDPSGND